MKIRINKDGFLEIERAGKWKEQICPYTKPRKGHQYIETEDVKANYMQVVDGTPCGDWCPLFSENISDNYIIALNACHVIYETPGNEIEDLRNV